MRLSARSLGALLTTALLAAALAGVYWRLREAQREAAAETAGGGGASGAQPWEGRF